MPSLPHVVGLDLAAVRASLSDLAPRSTVVVAVSGGSDSVALAHLLCEPDLTPGLRLTLAHLDHTLRPESADDCAFVADLADRLGVGFRAGSADVAALARDRGHGLEEAGRSARQAFLARVATEVGACAVALGHTRDDQAETLLLHLARGCGPGALAGMRPVSGLYRRPLLYLARADLRHWLKARGLRWRDDPTRDDPRFLRNRVRLELMPVLQRLNPGATALLARTATLAAAEDDVLDGLAREAFAALFSAGSLDATGLSRLAPGLSRRVALLALREWCGLHPDLGHRHVDALLSLAADRPGAHATDLPGGARLSRRGPRVFAEQP